MRHLFFVVSLFLLTGVACSKDPSRNGDVNTGADNGDTNGTGGEGLRENVVFYVDATDGDDSNSGRSESEPWKTFGNINGNILDAGTQILLKRGGVWNERLQINGAGTAEAWIRVGSYDSGAKPKISLTNSADDIAILVTDLYEKDGNFFSTPMDYIHIDGVVIENTRLGIFYRTITSTRNTGLKITDVDFVNIQCDTVVDYINAAPGNLDEVLRSAKGNLQMPGGANGGELEYVYPAAVMIGGRTEQHYISGNHFSILTGLEVTGCRFDDVFTGIMAWFYWPYAPGNPDDIWRQLIHKVRIEDCVGTGFVNGIIAFDGVNGNAVTDAEGIASPDAEGWGVIRNVRVEEGALQPNRTLLNGTTAVIINNTQNFLFEKCEFSRMTHHGNPDGCGFDFESHNSRITLRNSKFEANRGESILLMNGGGYGPNSAIRIYDNIFVDNLKGTAQFNHELSFSHPNDGHFDVKVYDNTFFMNKVNEVGQKITMYDTSLPYVTAESNALYYLDASGPAVTGTFWGQPYSYNAIPAN